MPASYPHTISKLALQIEALPVQPTSELMANWSEWAKGPLPARLEALLDKHSPPDEGYLRIDQLELELELDGSGWNEKTLEAAFETAFEQAMLKALRVAKPALPPGEQALVWLKAYLDTGAMPFNAPIKMTVGELEILLARFFKQADAHGQLDDFIRWILGKKSRLERLLVAFNPPIVWALLASRYPAAVQKWPTRQRHQLDTSTLSKKLSVWGKLLADGDASPAILNAMGETPNDDIAEKGVLEEESQSTNGNFFIRYAGLVILHPFLEQFLKTLLGDEAWDDTQRATAVHLVHYLATGEAPQEEWNLPLPKLLCGWPMDKAVPMGVPLPDDAASASQQLLEAVIGHWAILKNTTVQGLREAYLQREGLLTDMGDYWQLQVEQRPYDMLLEQLPWGIGLVLNKHMGKRLVVQW